MRSTKIAFLLGSMILLLAGCALSEPTKYGQGVTGTMAAFDAAQNSRIRVKTSLRMLRESTNTKVEELGGEERTISLSGMKKWVPGTSAYKDAKLENVYKKIEARQWKGLRKIEVNKKKALSAAKVAAQKEAVNKENAKIFDGALTDSKKRQAMFEHFYDKRVPVSHVKKMMRKAGKNKKEIKVIVDDFKAFKTNMRNYIAVRDPSIGFS
nr:RxLR effector protein 1b [Phytophthora cinnamomi]